MLKELPITLTVSSALLTTDKKEPANGQDVNDSMFPKELAELFVATRSLGGTVFISFSQLTSPQVVKSAIPDDKEVVDQALKTAAERAKKSRS